MDNAPADIDAYLDGLPEKQRATLSTLRTLICEIAPDAVESISYGLPTFKHGGRPLVYFGAAKQHCAMYGTAAGTLRFPHDELPPAERVRELVLERMAAIDADATRPRRKASSSADA